MKYKRRSIRRKNWRYGGRGTYFVTLCTKYRKPWFGKLSNGKMELSRFGEYASQCWEAIPQHFPKARIGEFVVMHDHIHGVIHMEPQPGQSWGDHNKFGPQSKNLASVIRGFKVGVTKLCRQHNPSFAWHRNYHESIIQNGMHLQCVNRYIRNNPKIHTSRGKARYQRRAAAKSAGAKSKYEVVSTN